MGRGSGRAVPGRDPEEGRVGLLTCAACAFVCVFLLVSIAVTGVAVQDRRLLACADRVAATAAGVIDGASVYAGGSGAGAGQGAGNGADEGADADGVPASLPDATAAAERALAQMGGTTCAVGEGVRIESASLADGDLRVSVRARATVAFLPSFLATAAAPVLVRSSSARVHEG
ncbi:hypothetical protein HMPREF1550_00159 [Actinomyces sp. oral taxon 877 str. F0543]|nr:hypothetical protein HMPREF1550_00159 [Actinomyces sp. oral taxon 877 str. F0543]